MICELLAQAALHCVFIGINSVFCKPARFDISVKKNDARSEIGKFTSPE
jgi:hypothetical protein